MKTKIAMILIFLSWITANLGEKELTLILWFTSLLILCLVEKELEEMMEGEVLHNREG